MHGPKDRELPGHALVSDPTTAFHDLAKFGNAFLSRFAGCEVDADFARGCTLIDVRVPPLAVPQLVFAPCSNASSGRAWRLWAARHSQSEAQPLIACF